VVPSPAPPGDGHKSIVVGFLVEDAPSSLKPTAFASPRRVMPVMSGSVPRKRAHAACDDAATALDPPPMTLVATKRCPDSDDADDVQAELKGGTRQNRQAWGSDAPKHPGCGHYTDHPERVSARASACFKVRSSTCLVVRVLFRHARRTALSLPGSGHPCPGVRGHRWLA
jgi:hypothetical protein